MEWSGTAQHLVLEGFRAPITGLGSWSETEPSLREVAKTSIILIDQAVHSELLVVCWYESGTSALEVGAETEK